MWYSELPLRAEPDGTLLADKRVEANGPPGRESHSPEATIMNLGLQLRLRPSCYVSQRVASDV